MRHTLFEQVLFEQVPFGQTPESKLMAAKFRYDRPVERWRLKFQGEWPTAVAFIDSRTVVAGNRGGDLVLWRLPEPPPGDAPSDTGGNPGDAGEAGKAKAAAEPPDLTPLRQFVGHTNGITHLRPVAGSGRFVSASLDHTLRIWDAEAPAEGKREIVLDREQREQAARRAPEAEREVILNAPGLSLDAVPPERTLEVHRDWVKALDVHPDGTRMLSGDDSCLSVYWDLARGEPLAQWRGYPRVWVTAVALSPVEPLAFTAEFADRRSSFDVPAPQARLWNPQDGSPLRDLLKIWTPKVKDDQREDTYGYMQQWSKLIKRGLVCAAFSPDGALLAAGQGGETDTGQVHVIDVESGKILRTIAGHRYGVCDVKFSADGQFLLSAGRDTTLRICQVSDGKQVAELGEGRGGQFKDWLHAIALSPDQRYVAAADIAGMVRVWQLTEERDEQ